MGPVSVVFAVSLALAGLPVETGAQVQPPGIDLGPGSGSFGPPSFEQGEDCAGGEIYDDGVAENGYSGNPAQVSTFEAVHQFSAASASEMYVLVCVGLVSLGGPTLDFEIIVYQDAGGTPGAIIGSIPASVSDIPGGLPGQGYGVDISSLGVTGGQSIFIGVRWNPMAFPSRFIMSDESVATPLHLGFVNFNLGGGWQATQTVFPAYRALLVRAIATPLVPALPQPMLLVVAAAALLAAGALLGSRRARA